MKSILHTVWVEKSFLYVCRGFVSSVASPRVFFYGLPRKELVSQNVSFWRFEACGGQNAVISILDFEARFRCFLTQNAHFTII